LEVFNLHHEELDTNSPTQVVEAETVICPHCKGEVPSSIYCGACGCPLEMEAVEEAVEMGEIHFNLEPLKNIQGKIGSQKKEDPTGGHSVEEEDTIKELKFSHEPMENEGSALSQSFEAIKVQPPKNALEALDTSFHEGTVSPRDVLSDEVPGDHDPVIDELAIELLNSVYLELWSVGLLRRNEMDENQFLKVFEGFRDRFERCMDVRSRLLDQIGDLGAYEAKVREARIELDKLDVRKSLGDLHEGEYQTIVPALKWTIDYNGAESEKLQNRIALLEDPMSLMPAEKVREVTVMVEESVEIIREAEAFARLSSSTAAAVRDSIRMIQDILKRKASRAQTSRSSSMYP
jgi:hypothetical protein